MSSIESFAEGASGTEQLAEAPRDRVLVVEDSRAMRALLGSHLARIEGIEIVEAASLAEAGAILARDAARICVAVLDLNLEDAPHGEIVALVRGFDIPIIVLTGTADEAVRTEMRRQLVLEYVVKREQEEIAHVAWLVRRLFENQLIEVLVVDDSRAYRSWLAQLLRNHRYRCWRPATARRPWACSTRIRSCG